jgi:heptosyltransferase II
MIKRIISNIFLIIKCFLFHGLIRKVKNKEPRKILIIQGARLGDMVCTTPMFKAIKDKFPKCFICAMGDKINKDVLEYNPFIDKYEVKSKNIEENVRIIKKYNFDYACSTNPDFEETAAMILARVPKICVSEIKNGFCPFETKSYKLIRVLVEKRPHFMNQYAPREYLRLLEPVGIFSEDTEKHLFYSVGATKKAKEFFESNNLDNKRNMVVGIAPSAGNKLKIWGGKKFAELSQKIKKNYDAKIIILGSEGDREYIDEMINELTNMNNIVNTCGLFNLDELKAVISKIDIFIGPDTGLIYIAESFGKATIDIVGPVDENVHPPKGEKNKIAVSRVYCYPCTYIMNTPRKCKNKREPFICFNNISVMEVFNIFKELVKVEK